MMHDPFDVDPLPFRFLVFRHTKMCWALPRNNPVLPRPPPPTVFKRSCGRHYFTCLVLCRAGFSPPLLRFHHLFTGICSVSYMLSFFLLALTGCSDYTFFPVRKSFFTVDLYAPVSPLVIRRWFHTALFHFDSTSTRVFRFFILKR